MEVLAAFAEGLQILANFQVWLLIGTGMLVGLTFGLMPGLSAVTAMAILLPFIFQMLPEHALPLFMGVAAIVPTAGSITSVLLGVPGTGVNVATLIDGYPMTQKGEGSRALGAALTASGMGGVIGVVFAILMIPLLLPLVFAITSADMVFLILMGLAFIVVLNSSSGTSLVKGLIAGSLGLLMSSMGLHVTTGLLRFNFGTIYLMDGLSLIPVVLGLFALPQMISLAAKGGSIAQTNKVILSTRGVVEGAKDVFRHWGLWLRCSIIGYLIGVIPGVGSATATFVAYGQAKQTSKHPEKFGTGTVEGVIAPESCNNAKEGGALLTTMALGIPGSAEMVLVLGAIMMVGITPGPQMLISKLPLAFSLLQVIFVGSILGAIFCFLMAPRLARIATVPGRILFPIVGVVVFIGAFSRDERFLDLALLLIFTVIGLAMMKYGFNRPAMLLGYILGDLFEKYLFQAIGTAGPLFFMRPISLSIIFIILALFLWTPVSNWLSNRSKGGAKA
ncbi:tripartite tricarboxylate transporter permease [Chloroflexota bacterium]